MDSLVDIDDTILKPPWGRLGRAATLGLVSGYCKFVLSVLNTATIRDQPRFTDAVLHRSSDVGLLTFSNHTSTLDDPGVLSILTPWSYFWTEGFAHTGMRWSLCAQEICFKNELLRQFFLNGKTLPIQRGKGIEQPILHLAAELLAKGDWIHVFPEGRINLTGSVGPFRWGAGKLICDAKRDNGGRDPVVLPFYHSGLSAVVPLKHYLPSVGHAVHVTVGEPMDLRDLTCRCNVDGEDQQAVWRDIAKRMHHVLCQLEKDSPPNGGQEE